MKNDINNISSVLNLEDEENRIIKLPLLLGGITEWCKDTFAKNKNNPTQQIVLINQLNATLKSVNMNLASILESKNEILALAQDQTQELKNSEEEYNEIVEKVKRATEQAKKIEAKKAEYQQKKEELDILKNKLQYVPPTELNALIDEINQFAKDNVPSYGDFKRCKAELLSSIPSIQENIEQFSNYLEQENQEITNNLNSQLEGLKNQRTEFDKELQRLDEQKKAQENEITDLTNQKDELQDKNKKLTDQINKLNTELAGQNNQLSTKQTQVEALKIDIEKTKQDIEKEKENFDALDQRRIILVKHYENNRKVAEAMAAGNFPTSIQAALDSAQNSLEEFDNAISEQLDLRESGTL